MRFELYPFGEVFGFMIWLKPMILLNSLIPPAKAGGYS